MRPTARDDEDGPTLEPWLEDLVRDAIRVDARLPRSLPAVVGDYELTEVLGQGGLGIVYGARDARLERPVAIKVLRTDLRLTPAHVEREARVLAVLRHPAIVSLYGLHEDRGEGGLPELFLVMERVEGRTLAEVLTAGRVDPGLVRRWGAELLDAMAHAHARNVVHGDLKPGNVMVEADGRLRVLDFGLGRRVGEDDAFVGGTPGYMAPEQARGESSPRSDVYALGLLLRELQGARARARGRDAPRAFARERVIARALQVEPTRRPPDARALAAAWAEAEAFDARQRSVRRAGAFGLLALAAAAGGVATAGHRTLAPSRWTAEPWLDQAPRDRLKDVALSPDGRSVALLDQHGHVTLTPFHSRRALTDESRPLPLDPDSPATALAWASNESLLVTVNSPPSLRAWDTRNNRWRPVDAPAGPMAAASDADLLLVTDREARFVHVITPAGRLAHALREGTQLLTRAVPSPDGRWFAAIELLDATSTTRLTVRDVRTGEVALSFDEPRLQQVDAEAGLAWSRQGLVYTRARVPPDDPGTDLVLRATDPTGLPARAGRVTYASAGRFFSHLSASADGQHMTVLQPTLEFRTQLGRVAREGGRVRVTDLVALDSTRGDRVSAFSARGIYSTASFVRATHDALVRDVGGANARPALELPPGWASSGPMPAGDGTLLAWVWHEGTTIEPRLERWRDDRRERELLRLPPSPLVVPGVPPRSARVRCGGSRCVLGVRDGRALELRDLAALDAAPLVHLEGATADALLLWGVSPQGRLAWCEATAANARPGEIRVEGQPPVPLDAAFVSRSLTWDADGTALWISGLERPLLRRFALLRTPIDGSPPEIAWSPLDEVPAYVELSPDGTQIAISGGRLDVDAWKFEATELAAVLPPHRSRGASRSGWHFLGALPVTKARPRLPFLWLATTGTASAPGRRRTRGRPARLRPLSPPGVHRPRAGHEPLARGRAFRHRRCGGNVV